MAKNDGGESEQGEVVRPHIAATRPTGGQVGTKLANIDTRGALASETGISIRRENQ
jgi:hypothetical protein